MRKCKKSTLEQQRETAELELIIEDFGRAMRDANREFVSHPPSCSHVARRFTAHMEGAWSAYILFCREHPNEES